MLMGTPLNDAALDTLLRNARTQNKWLDKPVTNEQLVTLYDLMKWGPTSANSFPVRIVFVTTPAAKERLNAHVFEGNRPKVIAAPVTAIIAYDTRFYEWLPRPSRPQSPGRPFRARNARCRAGAPPHREHPA